jgi:hypothetical protein
MTLLARIIREERRLEKKVLEFQKQLDAARQAARALGHKSKRQRNKKRRMSPAGRRKIARAQRRRWAAIREARKAAD